MGQFLKIFPRFASKKMENMTSYLNPSTYIDMNAINNKIKDIMTQFKDVDPDKLKQYADYMIDGLRVPSPFSVN